MKTEKRDAPRGKPATDKKAPASQPSKGTSKAEPRKQTPGK
ncbi:MAG: hypothetical protein R3288_02070 [Woeseiaceae bacterium]|nr:hypothetical protein [Woeseiaceae bacterium]